MDHLRQWEWSRGHNWLGEEVERNVPREVVQEFVFVCEVCGKVCKSKAGLTIHRKRMHEESNLKKLFKCDACDKSFKQEANLRNHVKVCTGGEVEGERVNCDACGKDFKKKGYPRHRSASLLRHGVLAQDAQLEPEPVAAPARIYKAKRKLCPQCGIEMAATNVSRHIREACRGGGANP